MEKISLNSSFESFIDQDEVNLNIIKHLNSVFGKDIKNLSKVKNLVEELTETQNELKDRLLFATSEAPDKISKAISEAEEVLLSTKQLEKKFNNLNGKLTEYQSHHTVFLDALMPDIQEYRHFKEVEVYQKWISNTQELSTQIMFHLKAGNHAEVMLYYDRFKESTIAILSSKCDHLTQYCSNTLLYFYKLLKSEFEKDVEKELKAIKWPFTSSNASVNLSSIPLEASQNLENILANLIQLELPKDVMESFCSDEFLENETNAKAPTLLQDFVVTLVPVQLLLKPLEVRFLFHFSGSKVTNSRNNPEWYLTQVLKWIGAHETFIENRIQPILLKNKVTNAIAKVEFMRGLVRLVVLKLLTDLPEITNDEDLFSQTIQGTLNFERELRLGLDYPISQPSVLGVLTQPAIFNHWIFIERKFALELMDEFVSSANAWQSQIDEDGVCHCGQQLILLLQGIADRYKPLPQPRHRMQFLELQLELLDDFRVRILQITKNELSDPLQSNFCSILNTVNHIQNTLAEWSDLPFYIEMQYYREQFGNSQDLFNSAQNISDKSAGILASDYPLSSVTKEEIDVASSRQGDLYTFDEQFKPSKDSLTISGSVFDEISQLYLRIEREMMSVVTQHVMTEIRARSQPYRKDKWFVTPSSSNKNALEVSPSLCALLQVLVKHLYMLKDKLSSELFTIYSKNIASNLNKYIYEEVILQNHFSEYGAAQLKYDMTKAIFPIFGEYHTKPELLFPHIKDCLILLTLPRPTALLLRDTIKNCDGEKDFSNLLTSPVKALEERSVFTLNVQEAQIILNIRTNMANS